MLFCCFFLTDIELGQSKDVYDTLWNINNNEELWNKLNASQQRIIEAKLLSMRHAGVGLNGESQKKFNSLQLEAARLSSQFKNNVLDSTKLFAYKIENSADMEGVPEDAKALFSQRAVAAGYSESNPKVGPWVVTLDIPSCK